MFLNSTEIVANIFKEEFLKNPLTSRELSRKEKQFLPNHIIKLKEIKKTYGLDVMENQQTWRQISVTDFQEKLSCPQKLIKTCLERNIHTLGDMFVREQQLNQNSYTKRIILRPKKHILNRVWKNFNTELTRDWEIITIAAQLLINDPIIRIKKALSKAKDIEMGSLMEEENMIIATDGSFKDNEGGIGIVTEKGEKINMNAFAAASSFDCEIQAIYIACKMTKGNIQILTDSMASIKIIEGDRKTNNPYVKAIRKEKQRITLRHIKSHQVETQQMTHEEKALIQLNNEADIEANRGRKNRNKTKAIPPAQELDRYLFTFNEKIIYDKIDTILYSEIFKEEVAKANLNAFSNP